MANRIAVLETTQGVIKAELFDDNAPNTAANFAGLIEKGFYNGLTFHRYVPGFVVQGGDPVGNGSGGSGKNIALEVSKDLKHDTAGVLSMARSSHPDSASSQFFITLAATPHLDMGYAVFGKVTEGLQNALKLRAGDKMIKVTLEK